MKKITIILILLLSGLVVIGQGLKLFKGSDELEGDTIIVNCSPDEVFVFLLDIKVLNANNQNVKVLVRKTELLIEDGSENSFCWGVCYLPSAFVSFLSVELAASESDSTSFRGEYMPQGTTGTTIIEYVFFDQDNPADSTYFTALYNSNSTGINISPNNYFISPLYPNPAKINASFRYSVNPVLDNRYRITNLIGVEIVNKKINESSGIIDIDVTELGPGIYFFSCSNQKEIHSTQKLIIR